MFAHVVGVASVNSQLYIVMALARQFIKARLAELRDGVWELVVQYSYYGLYTFEERSIHVSLEAAKDKLISLRCPDYLAIDKNSTVLTLQT